MRAVPEVPGRILAVDGIRERHRLVPPKFRRLLLATRAAVWRLSGWVRVCDLEVGAFRLGVRCFPVDRGCMNRTISQPTSWALAA